MYRIDFAVTLLALLPLIVAVVFRAAVLPDRISTMVAALTAAESRTDPEIPNGKDYVLQGRHRVVREFGSLYNTRLIFPAFLLSLFYLIGFSLGVLLIATVHGVPCPAPFCRSLMCIPLEYLRNPEAALVGCYVFNTGVLIRRSFAADITKNVFWGAINRVILSVGFSIAVAISPLPSYFLVSFAIAFFPRLFVTWLRKLLTKTLALNDSAPELDIQLVQGIDVWKEERLEEEGIESVQNLATADALSLAVKTHYPQRTIIDWIDQALLIQRFPRLIKAIQDAGLAISAIEFCLMCRSDNDAVRNVVGAKTGIDPVILQYSMQTMYQDAAIQNIWHLWQTPDADE